MYFIKRNYKKFILGLSLCLTLMFSIFAITFASADEITYQDVYYSNTINITSGITNNDTYEQGNGYYGDTYELSNMTTENYIISAEFIPVYMGGGDSYRYFGFNYITNQTMLEDVPMLFYYELKFFVIDTNNDVYNLEWESDIDYLDFDYYFDDDSYGVYYNNIESAFYEYEKFYYYRDLTNDSLIVYNYDYPLEDYENLSFSFYLYEQPLHYESGMRFGINIVKVEIMNDVNAINNFNSLSLYKKLYDNLLPQYNDLLQDYNDLNNEYNDFKSAYNDIVNGQLPFRQQNIDSVVVSTTNNGDITSDYSYILIIQDKQLTIDSSAIRDIVDAYNISQSSSDGITITLNLKQKINLYYYRIKINSSEFEYEFIFTNNNIIKEDLTLTSSSGENSDGDFVSSDLNGIDKIIINITNINNSHYGDVNTFLLTNATYFDGYADASKLYETQIDGYKRELNRLNDVIIENRNSINSLKTQVSSLNDALNNNFGWKNLFLGMADTPLKVVHSVLGFEIFGLNLFTTFIGIITVCAIVYLLKKFF